MKKDPRVDAYIASSGDFAKPILNHFRSLVHANCTDVEEAIKWKMPFFMYKGMLCNMAAFKEHCAIGFWKGDVVMKAVGHVTDMDAMGQFGRITSMKDMPSTAILTKCIKAAVKMHDDGVKSASRIKPVREAKPIVVPPVLVAALKKNKKAQAAFEAFSPSHKREYSEWIGEAKTEETQSKRLATALEWMSEGKSRHWKYSGK